MKQEALAGTLSLQEIRNRNKLVSGDCFGFSCEERPNESGRDVCSSLFRPLNCKCTKSFKWGQYYNRYCHVFIYEYMPYIQMTDDGYITETAISLSCIDLEEFAKIHKDEKFAIFANHDFFDKTSCNINRNVYSFIAVCVLDKEKTVRNKKVTWKIVSKELKIDDTRWLSESYDWLSEEDFFKSEVYKKAEDGDAECMYKVAECYLYGLDIVQNITKANTWLEEAAKKNYVPALHHLGERTCWYEHYNDAVRYFERAVGHNSAESAYELGQIFTNCNYGLVDYDKALAFYEKSLALGFDEAKKQVDRYKPLIEEKNSLISKAENGDAKAQYELALKYFDEHECYGKNEGIVLDLMEKSARNNYAEAQFFLAFCYNYGYGVKKDKSMDKYWVGKAAENGHVMAMTDYAQILINEGNPTEGLRYLKAAVEAKHPDAIFYMAAYYYKGIYVEQDINKAIAMFEESYKLGEPSGASYLGEIYETVTKDFNKAIEWYQKAADADIKDAKAKVIELKTKQNSN